MNGGSHKGSNNPLQVPSIFRMGKDSKSGPKSRIERVDLAQGRDQDECAKVGPRHYRNLYQLHEKVTKALPVAATGHTKPSYSYSKGEQLKFSFLTKATNSVRSFDKVSSDYDDSGMDDLPSPSALLAQKSHAKTDTSKDSVKAADRLAFDEDISDIEADMIGLSDSIALRENPTYPTGYAALSAHIDCFDTDAPEENDDVTLELPVFLPPPESRDKIRKQDKAEKLFMSTDSPEKPSLVPMKRRVTAPSDHAVSLPPATSLSKKPKLDDGKPGTHQPSTGGNQVHVTDSPPLSSATLENQAPSTTPYIKAGHPAWVYDLDPAFVAEYEDYVNFV